MNLLSVARSRVVRAFALAPLQNSSCTAQRIYKHHIFSGVITRPLRSSFPPCDSGRCYTFANESFIFVTMSSEASENYLRRFVVSCGGKTKFTCFFHWWSKKSLTLARKQNTFLSLRNVVNKCTRLEGDSRFDR